MTRLLRFAFGALALCAAALPVEAAPIGDAVYRPESPATVQTVQYNSHFRSHRYHRYQRRHYSHRYRQHFYDRRGAYRRY